MALLLFILAVIVFIISDLFIRYITRRVHENKVLKERENVLKESLNLDFSREAKTLKRANVENPKAKILCIDDEPVILDSFRKILVLDGYSVDTVENGKDALGLVQAHSYDFVFADLKMPEMDGVEVTKSIKHLRPDIDVIIITGYATVETAVECMKYGAMDYVQKPFTEDELLDFTKKSLIKRADRISKTIMPKVLIKSPGEPGRIKSPEFQIPGGVFISENHCWLILNEDGTVNLGIDDFAVKIIGSIDSIVMPETGLSLKKDLKLFIVKQGQREIIFKSPLSGRVIEVNKLINSELDSLNITPYDKNWICRLQPDDLDLVLPGLKIGKSAVSFYHEEINRLLNLKKNILTITESKPGSLGIIYYGEMEKLDAAGFKKLSGNFFEK